MIKTHNPKSRKSQNPKYNSMIQFDSSQINTLTIRKENEKPKSENNQKSQNDNSTHPFLEGKKTSVHIQNPVKSSTNFPRATPIKKATKNPMIKCDSWIQIKGNRREIIAGQTWMSPSRSPMISSVSVDSAWVRQVNQISSDIFTPVNDISSVLLLILPLFFFKKSRLIPKIFRSQREGEREILQKVECPV